jgi:hypothetical protein
MWSPYDLGDGSSAIIVAYPTVKFSAWHNLLTKCCSAMLACSASFIKLWPSEIFTADGLINVVFNNKGCNSYFTQNPATEIN